MTEILLFSLPKWACAAFVLLCATNSALADCGQSRLLSGLTTEMRLVATRKVSQSPESMRRVARHVENIQFLERRGRFDDLKQDAQFQHVEGLLAIAARYSRKPQKIDYYSLEQHVRNVERLMATACTSSDDAAPGGSWERKGANGVVAHLMISGGQFLRILLLLLVLIGVIGLMFLSKYVYGYLHGLVNHRKFCRVKAQIRGNGQVFQGVVTRAGLDGVRFEFESDAVSKSLGELLASRGFVHFDLLVGDDVWPVFVDGIHKFFTPLYFLTRASRGELKRILDRSTRAVETAPSIGHKSNKRKWRSEIEQRKALIRSIAQQRAEQRGLR